MCHEHLADLKINNRSFLEVFATVFFARGLMCFQSIVVLRRSGVKSNKGRLTLTHAEVESSEPIHLFNLVH
jgi:hypothetical protein